jgi:hypothetical protein
MLQCTSTESYTAASVYYSGVQKMLGGGIFKSLTVPPSSMKKIKVNIFEKKKCYIYKKSGYDFEAKML